MIHKKRRALEVRDAIRQVLFNEWDPIGVNNNPEHVGEYDSYIAPVYRLLSTDSPEEEIIGLLYRTEKDKMGVLSATPEQLRPIAQKLLGLDIDLDQKPGK
jgi:hypothetical protein